MASKKSYNDISKEVLKIRDQMNLHEWKIKIIPVDKDDDKKTYAATRTLVRYKEAEIEIFPNYFTQNKKEQYHILVHEVCHIITQQLVDCCWDLKDGLLIHDKNIIDIWENLTEKIARIYNI